MKTSKQQVEKKAQELWDLRPLMDLLGIEEEQMIRRDRDEEPDFVFLVDGKRIGIEHTRCVQNEYEKKVNQFEAESRFEIALGEYEKRMKARGESGIVTVFPHHNVFAAKAGMNQEKFSKAVCDEIDWHLQGKVEPGVEQDCRFVEDVDFDALEGVQSVVCCRVYDITDASVEALTDEVRCKEELAEKYIEANGLDELWLYVVFTDRDYDFVNFKGIGNSEKFDRIYIYAPHDRAIYDVSKGGCKDFPLVGRVKLA